MKVKKLFPKLTAPVQRPAIASTPSLADGIVASTHCDIITRECFPFADGAAE